MRTAGRQFEVLRLLCCAVLSYNSVCVAENPDHCASGHLCPTSRQTLRRYRHVGPPIYFSRRGMELNERPWHKQSVLLNNPR